MKKYIFLLISITILSLSIHAQPKVNEEQLLGNWEVVGGEGKEFEEDIIGTIFHFMPSNVLIAEKKSEDSKPQIRRGTWNLNGDEIILRKETEDKNSKGTLVIVMKIEENELILFDKEEEITIVFKRIKNNQ